MFDNHHAAERGGEIAYAGLKAAPAVAVSTATLGGMTLEEWVVPLTVAYLLMQMAYLLWRWARALKRDRTQPDGETGDD